MKFKITYFLMYLNSILSFLVKVAQFLNLCKLFNFEFSTNNFNSSNNYSESNPQIKILFQLFKGPRTKCT